VQQNLGTAGKFYLARPGRRGRSRKTR